MDVVLTGEMEEIVRREIAAGRFAEPVEVVWAALRGLEERNEEFEAERQLFDEELGRRLEALDRGEFVTPEAAKAHFEQKSREWRRLRA